MKRLGIVAFCVALVSVSPGAAQVKGAFDFDDGTAQGWHIAGLYEGGGLVQIPGAFSGRPAPWMDDLDAPAAPPKVDPAGDLAGAIVLGTPSAVLYPVGQDTVWAWHFNSPDLDRLPEWQAASAARIQVVNLMTTEVSTSQNWIELVVVLMASQESVVQASPSSQLSGLPGVQMPSWQVSAPLQTSPSLQLVSFGAFRSAGQSGLEPGQVSATSH